LAAVIMAAIIVAIGAIHPAASSSLHSYRFARRPIGRFGGP
jgi:hypothetical protein